MVVDDIKIFFENEINLSVKGIIDSPILGPKGNKEFLIYGQK
jgi:predicted rRNA methylase YqxC with S4 and FtsJ domains